MGSMYRALPRVCFGGAAVCSKPPPHPPTHHHRSVGRRDNITLVSKMCVKCVLFTHSYVSVLRRAVSGLGPDLGSRQRRRTTPLQSTGHPPAGPQPQQLRTAQEAPPVLLLKLPVWNRSQAQTSPGHLKSPYTTFHWSRFPHKLLSNRGQ